MINLPIKTIATNNILNINIDFHNCILVSGLDNIQDNSGDNKHYSLDFDNFIYKYLELKVINLDIPSDTIYLSNDYLMDIKEPLKAYQYLIKSIMNSKMSGKMEGIKGLTTSCHACKYCHAMAQNQNSICSHCYSQKNKRWKNARSYIYNTLFLSYSDKYEKMPIIPTNNIFSLVNRFNSHGELVDVKTLKSFNFIAEHNPGVTFTLWTKRMNIINILKPKLASNLQIIHSHINLVTKNNLESEAVNLVQFAKNNNMPTFVVVDNTSTAEELKRLLDFAGIEWSVCGAKCCATCQNCYMNYNKSKKVIIEFLK